MRKAVAIAGAHTNELARVSAALNAAQAEAQRGQASREALAACSRMVQETIARSGHPKPYLEQQRTLIIDCHGSKIFANT